MVVVVMRAVSAVHEDVAQRAYREQNVGERTDDVDAGLRPQQHEGRHHCERAHAPGRGQARAHARLSRCHTLLIATCVPDRARAKRPDERAPPAEPAHAGEPPRTRCVVMGWSRSGAPRPPEALLLLFEPGERRFGRGLHAADDAVARVLRRKTPHVELTDGCRWRHDRPVLEATS